MSKLEDARKILTALQVPKEQRNDMCCYVLIVLAGIDEDGKWEQATNKFMRIHDIRLRIKTGYNVEYAENTRESLRKEAVKPFMQAAFVEKYAVWSPLSEKIAAVRQELGVKPYKRIVRCF